MNSNQLELIRAVEWISKYLLYGELSVHLDSSDHLHLNKIATKMERLKIAESIDLNTIITEDMEVQDASSGEWDGGRCVGDTVRSAFRDGWCAVRYTGHPGTKCVCIAEKIEGCKHDHYVTFSFADKWAECSGCGKKWILSEEEEIKK